jgi:catechol 2,3-dioxygenase-like lactoylglutathione lyase family enzyme
MKEPWNLGIKVRDLDTELAFLEACGATGIEKGKTAGAAGDKSSYGMAFLGAQRLLLFPHVLYEDDLAEPLKYGLAHAVFEVEAVDPVVQRLGGRGVRPIWGPKELPTAFGKRYMAFFRSPSGFIFEVFEHRT